MKRNVSFSTKKLICSAGTATRDEGAQRRSRGSRDGEKSASHTRFLVLRSEEEGLHEESGPRLDAILHKHGARDHQEHATWRSAEGGGRGQRARRAPHTRRGARVRSPSLERCASTDRWCTVASARPSELIFCLMLAIPEIAGSLCARKPPTRAKITRRRWKEARSRRRGAGGGRGAPARARKDGGSHHLRALAVREGRLILVETVQVVRVLRKVVVVLLHEGLAHEPRRDRSAASRAICHFSACGYREWSRRGVSGPVVLRILTMQRQETQVL